MILHPVVLEIERDAKGERIRASTSVDRALTDARSLEADLRCIELDYGITLAAVRQALTAAASGRRRDPRAFWFAGKHLTDFMGRLELRGFYLVDKNKTPARHLGLSRASVEKMLAFCRRYADPFAIDPSVPWSRYRDNKDRRVRR